MSSPSDPRSILIETSGAVGQVGLGLGRSILGQILLDQQRKHARDLIPQLQRLLKDHSLLIKEIDLLIVGWGPGSYTGLRVGLMTAKALAYALQKPLVTVPTLEIIAHQAIPHVTQNQEFEVIADAQQDRLYHQRFRATPDRAQSLSPLSLVEGKDWRASRDNLPLTGPGLKQQLPLLIDTTQALPESVWHPQLNALLMLGLERFESQTFADPFLVEPLYLRPSAAEVQWTALGR